MTARPEFHTTPIPSPRREGGIARLAYDPLYTRLAAALRARDLDGYFAAHDEMLSREAVPIAKLKVAPGEVLIVKCRSEHESLSGLVARVEKDLGARVKAVLLPGACEIAVTSGDGVLA